MNAFLIGAAVIIEVVQLIVIYLLWVGRGSCNCDCHCTGQPQASDIDFVEVEDKP